MCSAICRAAIVASAVAVVLGTGAAAAPAPVLGWSPGSFGFGALTPGAAQMIRFGLLSGR